MCDSEGREEGVRSRMSSCPCGGGMTKTDQMHDKDWSDAILLMREHDKGWSGKQRRSYERCHASAKELLFGVWCEYDQLDASGAFCFASWPTSSSGLLEGPHFTCSLTIELQHVAARFCDALSCFRFRLLLR